MLLSLSPGLLRRIARSRPLLSMVSRASPRLLNDSLILVGPKAGADTENHEQKDEKHAGRPGPGGRRPRVGMVHEDRHERVEKALVEHILEERRVLEVGPVQHKRLRAAGGRVRLVEAVALGGDGAIDSVLKVADACARQRKREKR